MKTTQLRMWGAAALGAMALAGCGGGGGDGGTASGPTGGASDVTLTFATSPANLVVLVDGAVTSATMTATPGATHTLSAPPKQNNCAGKVYTFNSWSDGGTASHSITVPSAATTYTANYLTSDDTNDAPTVVTLVTANTSGKVGVALNLGASALDSDGRIVKVEYLDGTTVIAESTTEPYTVAWTPAASGSRSLTARATDECGLTKSSAAITVTVAP